MEQEKVYKPKAAFIIAIVTLIISTAIFTLVATIGYESLTIKFDENKTAEGLALILLIPFLIVTGLALIASSLIGLISSIKAVKNKVYKVASIISLVLHSLFLITYLVGMVILFI